MVRGMLPTFGRLPTGAAFSVLAINLVFAGLVGLVVTQAGTPAVAWLRRPRLVHIGTISYGIYVYHYIILVLSDDLLVAFRGYGRTSPINVTNRFAIPIHARVCPRLRAPRSFLW
jgi:peptidoglycan/LPS O-acetylase OafA/YrhL